MTPAHLLAAAEAKAEVLSAETARLDAVIGDARAATWEGAHRMRLKRDMARALVDALREALAETPGMGPRPKLTSIRGVIQAFGGRAATCAAYGIKPPLLSDWVNKGRIPANRADQTREALADFEVHGSVFKMVGHSKGRGQRAQNAAAGKAAP